jgi:hypothetical protein
LLDMEAGRRTDAVRHLLRATWWAPDWRRRARWAGRTVATALGPGSRKQAPLPADEPRTG